MRQFFESLQSIEDVRALIDSAHRESETLEYKAAMSPFNDQQKNEIGKDVSAFANSSGGVIIYGVSNDGTDPTVVNATVRPPINGIERKCLPPDRPRVMLIYVPQSEQSPHQNSDGKYYHRSGTESRPMGHDLIELHFGRRRSPVLSVEVLVLQPIKEFVGEPAVSNDLALRVLVSNVGKRAARYVNVLLIFPPTEHVPLVATTDGNCSNVDRLYIPHQARQYTDNLGVFYPDYRTSILEMRLRVRQAYCESSPEATLIQWTVVADEMSRRTGSVSLKDLGVTAFPGISMEQPAP